MDDKARKLMERKHIENKKYDYRTNKCIRTNRKEN